MKIHGEVIEKPTETIVPIPRASGKDLIFKCAAIFDYTEFDQLCPRPKPPLVMRPGKPHEENENDPQYRESLKIYGDKRIAWMIIQSLLATDGFEWETVDLKDPATWLGYENEMKQVLTDAEVQLVTIGVTDANMPSDASQQEALDRFTLSQAAEGQVTTSSQKGEHDFTKSGELAND